MHEEARITTARQAAHSPTLRDIAAVLFRHKRVLLTSFALVAGLGILHSALFPSYQSEMKVLVRRGRIDPAITPTPSPSPAFEHDEVGEEELNSEVELLRDRDLLRHVVLENGLASQTWLSSLTGESSEQLTEKAVRRLARKLDVQPVRKSRLITISYKSSRPELSTAVLHSLARAYLARHTELYRPSGEQTFFEEQAKESRRSLEQAQQDLIAFTQQQGVASATFERDLALQKLSDAEAADLGLESAIAETSQRKTALELQLRDLPERRVVQIKNSDNPELEGKLKSKLLELELRRTELLTRFEPSYRLVQEVEEQITQAKAAIAGEDSKPLRDETSEDDPEYAWAHSERLKTQVDLAALGRKHSVMRAQVAAYGAQAHRLEAAAVHQRDLEQKLKAAEDKWLLYVNKREEARIGDALDQSRLLNVAIAEEPRTPALPVWPLGAASGLWLLGACGVSTGLVFAMDYFDSSFRSPDEVMMALNAPVLACFPAPCSQASVEEAS